MLASTAFVRAVAIVWVMAVYVAGAQLAVATEATTLPALLWAPTGIGLGAVVAFGPRLALGVAAGAFCAIISIGGAPSIAVGIGVIDAVEVLAAYAILRRIGFHCQLSRVRDVIALVSTSIVLTSLSAAASAGWLFATGQVHGEFAMVWSKWWWGHLAGDLILTPLFLTWLTSRTRSTPTLGRLAEGLALSVGVVVIGLSVFEGWVPHWMPAASRPHYLYPLLIWAGLRFGPRGAATTNTAVSVLAVTGIVYNGGPFMTIAEFQSFISISAVAALALGALRSEVSRAIRRKGAIQQAALDAIVTIDIHDRIVELNPAAERMFKIREQRARGRDVKSLLVPPSVRAQTGEGLARYVRRQGSALIGRRVRTTARRVDGTEFPAELAIVQASLGDEALFSASIRDISTDLEAEAARRGEHAVLKRLVEERTSELQRGEELLRQAQELAHVGSFEYDLRANTLIWSEELYRIYGRDPATFTPSYEAFLGTITAADREEVAAAIARAIDDRTAFSFEERILRPDGEVRVLQSQGSVKVGDDGRPARIVGFSQDITDRRRADAARFRLASLVESSHDAIISLSVDGRIETFNAAAEAMFGYPAAEVLGRNGDVLLPADGAAELRRKLEAVRAGQQVAHYERIHRRRDGSLFEASITLSPIRDQHQRVIGLSKMLRDTTEQKRARDLVAESLREKEVLLREIHHRVKNNLQVISSLLNLQLASEPSAEARKGLIESQSRIQSMALIHQLLYQSKDLARIDFDEYLRALVEYLVTAYDDFGRITATVNAPRVRLDLDRSIPCGLIVNELVTNSFRHAFPEQRRGNVSIDIRQADDTTLVLEVRDDGIGMPPDFDLQTAATFGLQIARSLTAQLGGTIELVPGTGTNVRITFPMASQRPSSPELAPQASRD